MTDFDRKPRIGLMGEFSSGKSTLSNLLLGARPLPEKVTATRLAPVWMSYGTGSPYRIDVDGTREPVDLAELEALDVEATRMIRISFEADILEVCDLIDFPGISDPNMSSDVWERMLCEVDAILWCTHATQAWRQSEAAVWATVPDAVKERSVLLVTKFDKLKEERDRKRVLSRLRNETEGQFADIFPIALTHALNAGDDHDAFNNSGAGAFVEHLVSLVDELDKVISGLDGALFGAGTESPKDAIEPSKGAETPADDETKADMAPVVLVDTDRPVIAVDTKTPAADMSEAEIERVVPRRVKANGQRQSARPQARPAVAPRNVTEFDASNSTQEVDFTSLREAFNDHQATSA